jgi:tRNA threonylcarbamoyladenosine biosynthesis protein TsaB
MLDARRMEVYCALLDHKLNYIEPVQAKVIDEESFYDIIESTPIFFFGDGADKCKDVIKHPNAHFSSGLIPLASSLGEIGYKKWKEGAYEDLVSFEPFYLKDFLIKKPTLD